MNKALMLMVMGQKIVFKGRAYFDGVGDYLSLIDSDDWAMGSGDFKIEVDIARNSYGSRQAITGQMASTGTNDTISFFLEFQADNTIRAGISSGVTLYMATSSGTVTDSSKHTIIFERVGNTATLKFDGTPVGSVSVTGITMNNSANQLAVGRLGEFDGLYLNSYISRFEIYKASTLVLGLQFNESLGATTFTDDTGKTVTTNGNTVIVA